MVFAFTGHRPKDLGNEYSYKGPYSDYARKEVQRLFDAFEPEEIFNGLAEGFDQTVCELAILNGIRINACVPFEGQELRWAKESQERYHKILSHSLVTIDLVSKIKPVEYWEFASMLYKRNEHMVDKIALSTERRLVAYWNGRQKGGTFHCIKYGRIKLEKDEIIYINPLNALK